MSVAAELDETVTMAVPKTLPSLLLAVVLLCVTFGKAAGQCHAETWGNATDTLKDKLPGFLCRSGKYQICDKDSVFSKPAPIVRDTCGVKLNCSGKNGPNNVTMTDVFFQRIKEQSVWIDMSSCGLERVVMNTQDWLEGRQYYFHLILADNKLRSISDIEGISKKLNLRTLDLSGNTLKVLNQLGSRFGYNALIILLNNNAISEVEDSVFDNVYIEILDMSDNAIRHITTDMFSGRKTAKTLLFRNNGIVAIVNKPFLDLKVSKLDISGNLLQGVDAKHFSGLRYLVTLLLSRNKISDIEASAFDGSTNLNYLDLSHNMMENIPANVFKQLRNLRTLIVSHNKLVAVGSNSFLGLRFSLLDLSNNPLQNLDPTCFNKTSVTELDISGCGFEQFPQDTIRFLDENLKEVNLSGNRITSFPTVGFDQDFLLRSLDLSHNQMENVGCCWLGDNLEILYLHGNVIMTIEKCLFTERMFTLASFSLAENPLDCCQMYWLKEIASASDNLLDSSTAMCEKPKGKPFMDTENCKDDSSGKTFELSDIIAAVLGTFFATLCLIGIVCALVFVIRRNRRRSQSSDSALRQRLPLPDIPTPGAKKGEIPGVGEKY